MPYYGRESNYGREGGRSGYEDVRTWEGRNQGASRSFNHVANGAPQRDDSHRGRDYGSHNRARSAGWNGGFRRPASEDRYKLYCPSILDVDEHGEPDCKCGKWVFRDRNKWACKCGRCFDYSEEFWRASMLHLRPGDELLDEDDQQDERGPYHPWCVGRASRPPTSPIYGGSASLAAGADWPAASAAQWPSAAGGSGQLRARSVGTEARLDPQKSFADDPLIAASITRVREGGNTVLADQMAAELAKSKPAQPAPAQPDHEG